MEKNLITPSKINPRTGKPKISSRGGARPNAGRPKGTTDKVTIAGLLASIENAAGAPYVDILAQDFTQARANDQHLAQKYHNLILNKVSASLAQVEVSSTADEVEAKRAAFAEAIAVIAGISEKK
jgi:hypothetical protein